MSLARRIEHPFDMAVQGSHDADAGEHRRPARRRHQDQGLHGRLPLRGLVLTLGKLRDVVAGILERDELPAAEQRNRIFEGSLPTTVSH